jgi:hypothetical protein
MDKHLVRCGNGFGVLIDKSMRALLDITPRTRLKVYTDGRRLVIDPIREAPAVTPVEELAVVATVRELVEYRGFSNAEIAQIHHRHRGPHAAIRSLIWAEALSRDATEVDLATARRFAVCLREVRAGARHAPAIETALREVPLPAEEAAATGPGSGGDRAGGVG